MRGLFFFGCIVLAAAFAGCTQAVVAPVSQQPIGNIDAYFWTNGQAPAKFDDTTGNPKYLYSLAFSSPANGTLAVSEFGHPTIECIVNQDSIYASGFADSSILVLDPGSYFSKDTSEVFDSVPPTAITISENPSRQIIVATDSGIYFYNPGVKDSFYLGGYPNGDVTALAVNSDKGIIFAGTASGKILYTNTPISAMSVWNSYVTSGFPTDTIKQLLWVNSHDSLFATVASQPGILVSNSGNPFTSLPLFQISIVSALGKYQTASTTYLLAGTTDGQIGAISLTLGKPSVGPSRPATSSNTIYCFGSQNQTEPAFAGTDSGIYEWFGQPTTLWTLEATLKYKPVTSLDVNSSQIIFLYKGGIYTSPITAPTATTLSAPSSRMLQVGWNATNPWILTTTGYDTENTARKIDPIPGLPVGYWHPDTGGLVLLRSNLFANDSSWRAGTLVTKDHQSHPITGHVLAHFDTLQVVTNNITKKYPDVLMVRYAHELSGANPESDIIPYWVVYYAKNIGPVMFDKIKAVAPGSQILGIERREIAP